MESTVCFDSLTTASALDVQSSKYIVGYADPSNVYPVFSSPIQTHLPLSHLQVSTPTHRPSSSTSLDVSFVPIKGSNYPPVCVYFATCEDMESYRTHLQPRLSSWTSRMQEQDREYVIAYVPLGTQLTQDTYSYPKKTISIYKQIVNALRMDFDAHGNSRGEYNRVVNIEYFVRGEEAGSSEVEPFISSLKACIVSRIQTTLSSSEENVKLMMGKRDTSKWDFSEFFMAKEQLAYEYRRSGMLDLCLSHLSDIQSVFSELKDTKTALGNNCRLPMDHPVLTLTPLSLDVNDFMVQVEERTAISDLVPLYLFIMRVQGLRSNHHDLSLVRYAQTFIPSFMSVLRSHWTSNDGTVLGYQWAIGACLELAKLVSLNAKDPSVATAIGDLLYLGRRLLRSFFKELAWDPLDCEEENWYMSLRSQLQDTDVSRKGLLTDVTQLAIHFYRTAGSRKRLSAYLELDVTKMRNKLRLQKSSFSSSYSDVCIQDGWKDMAVKAYTLNATSVQPEADQTAFWESVMRLLHTSEPQNLELTSKLLSDACQEKRLITGLEVELIAGKSETFVAGDAMKAAVGMKNTLSGRFSFQRILVVYAKEDSREELVLESHAETSIESGGSIQMGVSSHANKVTDGTYIFSRMQMMIKSKVFNVLTEGRGLQTIQVWRKEDLLQLQMSSPPVIMTSSPQPLHFDIESNKEHMDGRLTISFVNNASKEVLTLSDALVKQITCGHEEMDYSLSADKDSLLVQVQLSQDQRATYALHYDPTHLIDESQEASWSIKAALNYTREASVQVEKKCAAEVRVVQPLVASYSLCAWTNGKWKVTVKVRCNSIIGVKLLGDKWVISDAPVQVEDAKGPSFPLSLSPLEDVEMSCNVTTMEPILAPKYHAEFRLEGGDAEVSTMEAPDMDEKLYDRCYYKMEVRTQDVEWKVGDQVQVEIAVEHLNAEVCQGDHSSKLFIVLDAASARQWIVCGKSRELVTFDKISRWEQQKLLLPIRSDTTSPPAFSIGYLTNDKTIQPVDTSTIYQSFSTIASHHPI